MSLIDARNDHGWVKRRRLRERKSEIQMRENEKENGGESGGEIARLLPPSTRSSPPPSPGSSVLLTEIH